MPAPPAPIDNISNLIAQYLQDQDARSSMAAYFDHLIATDHPDLAGGLRLVKSPRHAGYVDASTYKKHLAQVREQMGWAELSAGAL